MSHKDKIHESAVKALEEHGHLFQQRCLEEAKKLDRYKLESEEYPVSIGDVDTVIDFVLSADTESLVKFYFVFECKRANPDYVTWLFPKARDSKEPSFRFLATNLHARPRADFFEIFLRTAELSLFPAELRMTVGEGLEVKDKENRGKRSKTDSIYGACQQVLTGIAGLALELKERKYVSKEPKPIAMQFIIPIVVTTAKLYVTEYNRTDVNLSTGKPPLSKSDTYKVDWVSYDFPLRGAFQIAQPEEWENNLFYRLRKTRQKFKVQSVAIVNSDHLAQFLQKLNLDT